MDNSHGEAPPLQLQRERQPYHPAAALTGNAATNSVPGPGEGSNPALPNAYSGRRRVLLQYDSPLEVNSDMPILVTPGRSPRGLEAKCTFCEHTWQTRARRGKPICPKCYETANGRPPGNPAALRSWREKRAQPAPALPPQPPEPAPATAPKPAPAQPGTWLQGFLEATIGNSNLKELSERDRSPAG